MLLYKVLITPFNGFEGKYSEHGCIGLQALTCILHTTDQLVSLFYPLAL